MSSWDKVAFFNCKLKVQNFLATDKGRQRGISFLFNGKALKFKGFENEGFTKCGEQFCK